MQDATPLPGFTLEMLHEIVTAALLAKSGDPRSSICLRVENGEATVTTHSPRGYHTETKVGPAPRVAARYNETLSGASIENPHLLTVLWQAKQA